MNQYDYIMEAFTKIEENVNLEVNNLNVGCITSKDSTFNLDDKGNLTVNSINAQQGLMSQQGIINLIYPIGSIYMSVNSISPAILFGGIWESWANGRVPIGVDATQDKFDVANKIGGEASHALTISEMPRHLHQGIYWANDPDNNGEPISGNVGNTGHLANFTWWQAENGSPMYTGYCGGNQPHNNLQPYITCYMWKRTA